MQGLKDGMAGNKPLLTDEEARAVLMQLQEEMRKKQGSAGTTGRTDEQDRRGSISGRQPDQGRRGHATERSAIQNLEAGDRAEAFRQ